jgi:hypothetical protein
MPAGTRRWKTLATAEAGRRYLAATRAAVTGSSGAAAAISSAA